MSSIKLQATPTGTGVVTLIAPTTNVDRTVTMPDQTGTIYISGGALGTPSSGTVTNLTGTASININGTVGATTPNTGAFTTLTTAGNANLGNSATGQTYITRFSGYAVNDGGLFGSFGTFILNANGALAPGERRWMVTNALNGTTFAIIRSIDPTTDPSIAVGGGIGSGTADFTISNTGVVNATSLTTTTQAVKTSDTTVATTAFVDRLRSLLTATTGSGGGTAVIGDRGCLLSVTAGVTVPANVFAANDTFSIYNNTAGNITITQGASLTLRQVGTANTGNRTLAQRGLVTVVFISATEAVISGGGLT